MTHPSQGSAVLKPADIGQAGTALRQRFDRRNLWAAVLIALAIHSTLVAGFWLYDRFKIQDIGDWSGPILVKIGQPDAPESPLADPGPLPEQSEEPAPVEPELPQPEQPALEPSAPVAPAESAEGRIPERESTETSETAAAERPSVPAAPVPSRVRGQEDGNSYEMNFDGTEGDVGRAAAYDFITSYMPLPFSLPRSLVEGADPYLGMSAEMVQGELSRYWEPYQDQYQKKNRAVVPMADRPYYWSLLVNSLGYNTADADWREAGTRPVVVEFTVGPSMGARGAELSNFDIVSGSRDPKVDQAVLYGLSRWVYYNKTDQEVRGRITYEFNR